MARLTLRLFGLEVFDLWASTDAEADEDEAAALNGGTTGSTPMGFVATFDQPDMVGLPDRWAE